MDTLPMSKTFDVISYLYSKKGNNSDPIVFWMQGSGAIFSTQMTRLYLYRDKVDKPGVYAGRINCLSLFSMHEPIDFIDEKTGKYLHPMYLMETDKYTPVPCARHIGTIYPISIHVCKGETIIYADEDQECSKFSLQRPTIVDATKPWTSAFKQLFEMDCPVEFIGAIRRGGEIQDIYEMQRIISKGDERRKEIAKTHAMNLANNWNPIMLEVVDINSNYKPNIVMWYHKEEPGRFPHTDFHMLDEVKGGLS